MDKSKRVEFNTVDGTALRGDIFLPSTENAPLVIMTQGLTLLKEHFINDFALHFQSSGFAVLLYDHRGYGSSSGTPRWETNPWQQAEDYSDAVTFASTLGPAVNASRICLWGIGHSGAAVMMTGADPRVKAFVIVMPAPMGSKEASVFPEMVKRGWADRAVSVGRPREEREYISPWPVSREHALSTGPDAPLLRGIEMWDFISGAQKRSDAAGTEFVNELSLQSFLQISKVEPSAHIYKIAPRPMLYLAAVTDVLTGPVEEHRKVFELAGEPKEFVVLDDHHLATYMYRDNAAFRQSVEAQIDFLRRCL